MWTVYHWCTFDEGSESSGGLRDSPLCQQQILLLSMIIIRTSSMKSWFRHLKYRVAAGYYNSLASNFNLKICDHWIPAFEPELLTKNLIFIELRVRSFPAKFVIYSNLSDSNFFPTMLFLNQMNCFRWSARKFNISNLLTSNSFTSKSALYSTVCHVIYLVITKSN